MGIKKTFTALLCATSLASTAFAATINTTFDEADIGSTGVSLDVPDAARATITLDTVDDRLKIDSIGNTDMWGARNGAPIAYIAKPTGSKWFIETEVELDAANLNRQVGIVVYEDTDGFKPDFILCLDKWGGDRIHLQGIGDNNPSINTSANGARKVKLRLEVLEDHYTLRPGSPDVTTTLYVARYDLLDGNGMKYLGTYTSTIDNARAGIAYKAANTSAVYVNDLVIEDDSTVVTDEITHDFETDAEGWTILAGASGVTQVNNNYGHYGRNQAITGTNDGPTATFRSPIFTLSNNANYDGLVTFVQGGGTQGQYNGSNDCYVAAYNASTGGEIMRTYGSENAFGAGRMAPRAYDLSAYKGQNIYFQVVDNKPNAWGHAGLDDLTLRGTAAAAPTVDSPANLTVSAVTHNSFTLTWDAVTDADNYTVTVAKNADLVTDTVTLPASGVTTNTTINITGLDSGTTYYFSVKATDTDASETSLPTGGSTKTHDAYTTTDTTNGDVTYIIANPWTLNNRFQIKGVAATGENTTAINTSGKNPVAYLDDFSSTQSISLTKDKSYDFDITIRDNNNNNGWIDGQVWVDWNRDGDFDDAGEALGLIGNGTSKGSRENTLTKSISVPAGASTGNTRMRIRVADSGSTDDTNMTPDSNTPINYGYAQDYTIAVQDPVVTEITAYDAISDVDAGPTNAPTYADAAAVITYLDANVTSATITGSSPAATTAITGWADTGTYNVSVPGSYTFTGTLDTANLPSGYVDAVNTITSVTVEVVVGNPTAALAIGDAIAVDLSSHSGSAAKFNVIVPSEAVSTVSGSESYRGTITSGNVVKYSDGTTIATGVSVTLENSFDATGGNDGKSDWTGTGADPYYVDAAEDIVYNRPTNPTTVTFSGLDNSLKYNVRIYALYDDNNGGTDTYTVTNGSGTETSVMSRTERISKATLAEAGGVFSAVETDGSGNIVASVQVTSGSGWNSFAAVVLEVVDPVTPAIGLELSLEGTELTWTVEDEIDVKEYRVVNAETKEVIETVLAVGADFYSVSVPEGVVLELVVVDNTGFTKSYAPADGNVKIEIYNLAEGWNLIAITSNDADLETLRDETVGVIWGWNGKGYEVVEVASATDAVWVYSPLAKQVYISGTKSTAEITLSAGWNMVGPVTETAIPADADTVFSWGDKIYKTIADEQGVLIGGKGYWIFSL